MSAADDLALRRPALDVKGAAEEARDGQPQHVRDKEQLGLDALPCRRMLYAGDRVGPHEPIRDVDLSRRDGDDVIREAVRLE